jgi:hypothetical protein
MSLKTRIDKAGAETEARLEAKQDAAIKAFVDLIDTGTPEEQFSYWRYVYSAGKELASWTDEQKAAFFGDHIDPTPEDLTLAQTFAARIPPELMARIWRLWPSPDDGGV